MTNGITNYSNILCIPSNMEFKKTLTYFCDLLHSTQIQYTKKSISNQALNRVHTISLSQ